MKKEYFNNRNQSIDSNDKDKTQRKIFAEREIKTLSILQDIVNENFYIYHKLLLVYMPRKLHFYPPLYFSKIDF